MATAPIAPRDASPATSPYERVDGIHVLRLHGDDYAMGHQHGELLRDAIARGPLPYFAHYVEKLLGSGLLGSAAAPVSRALGTTLQLTVGRRIARRFPARVRRALEGLADGAGMSRADLLRAATMPETYLWVGTQYKRLFRSPLAPRHGVPVIGCTSAVAWGDATAHGRLLHGRNFDYQGVGVWDREQAVIFHEPDDGQAYVSIAAAGVLLGGITAMNAAGISLVVHQHIACTDFDLEGWPVGVVGDEIMRHAHTLDDAKRILDGHRPNGAWTYVIASAREQRVLCYEVTSSRRASFEGSDIAAPGHEGTFGYSNVYLARELQKTEVDFYPSYWRNNVARYHAVNRRLGEARGRIDGDEIASILGDVDADCRFMSISSLTTVASVVFDGARGIVHVATGRPPVSNRPYLAFDLRQRGARTDLPRLLGGTRVPPAVLAGFDAYREGYEAHFNDGSLLSAREHVARERALDPDEPVYAFVAALLSLEAGDATAAVAALDEAIRIGHPGAERRAAFHLWRGRAYDLMGRRDDALIEYREARTGDPGVRRAAGASERRPYRRYRSAVEWSFGDVIKP